MVKKKEAKGVISWGGGQFVVNFSDVGMNEESCRYSYRGFPNQ